MTTSLSCSACAPCPMRQPPIIQSRKQGLKSMTATAELISISYLQQQSFTSVVNSESEQSKHAFPAFNENAKFPRKPPNHEKTNVHAIANWPGKRTHGHKTKQRIEKYSTRYPVPQTPAHSYHSLLKIRLAARSSKTCT